VRDRQSAEIRCQPNGGQLQRALGRRRPQWQQQPHIRFAYRRRQQTLDAPQPNDARLLAPTCSPDGQPPQRPRLVAKSSACRSAIAHTRTWRRLPAVTSSWPIPKTAAL